LADAKDVRLRPVQEDRRVGLDLAFEVLPVTPTQNLKRLVTISVTSRFLFIITDLRMNLRELDRLKHHSHTQRIEQACFHPTWEQMNNLPMVSLSPSPPPLEQIK
jgi:hypothetical protein